MQKLISKISNKVQQGLWVTDEHSIKIINQVRKEVGLNFTIRDSFNIYLLAKIQSHVCDGDFAEVGVYKGGSAKIISEAAEDKIIHLFDTFSGFDEKGISFHDDEQQLKVWDKRYNNFKDVNLEKVQLYLKQYKTCFHKGIFNKNDSCITQKRFSFVHFDADLYEPLKDCISGFYPRLNQNGMILVEDCSQKGTQKAIKESQDKFGFTSLQVSPEQFLILKKVP